MKPSGNLGGKAGQNGMKEEKSTVDTATEYLRISSGSKLAAMGNSQCLCIRCFECSTRADIDRRHKLSRAAPVHTSHTSNIRWCIYICSIPINHKNVLQTSRQLTSNQPWEQFSEARRGIFECPIVKATSSWCGGAKLRHGHGDKNQEHTAYKPLKLVSINLLGWKFWNLHPRPCQQDRHKGLSIRVQLYWWIKKLSGTCFDGDSRNWLHNTDYSKRQPKKLQASEISLEFFFVSQLSQNSSIVKRVFAVTCGILLIHRGHNGRGRRYLGVVGNPEGQRSSGPGNWKESCRLRNKYKFQKHCIDAGVTIWPTTSSSNYHHG